MWDVRRWAPSDLPAIAEFCCADYGQDWTRDAERVLRNGAEELAAEAEAENQIHDCLVAIADGDSRLLGIILFVPCDARKSLHVESVGVVRDFRDRGVGTELKRRAVATSLVAGATRVASEVHRRNFPMHRVNQKLEIEWKPDPKDGEYRLYASPIEFEDAPLNPDGSSGIVARDGP